MQVFDKQEKAYELRKIISILEWDMQFIKNNQLKEYKEIKLKEYKEQLKRLLESSIINE